MKTQITIKPKSTSQRAKNRMNEHTLAILKEGIFDGKKAWLTQCIDPECPRIEHDGSPWGGWFTEDEVLVFITREEGEKGQSA